MSHPHRSAFLSTEWLRHTVATLAYRAAKVLRDFPPALAEVRVAPPTRTPREVLVHLVDLLRWAEGLARGEDRWQPVPMGSWVEASEAFFAALEKLDARLAIAAPEEVPAEKIFQGPIADALTHVGQIAMLRGMGGAPVRPESYAQAEIQSGCVGREQATPRKEFDGDASGPRPRSSKERE